MILVRMLRLTFALLIAVLFLQSRNLLRAEDPKIEWIDADKAGLRIEIGPPVVVALAPPEEKRWGYHQFPKLSRLPDGGLLVTINESEDDVAEHGRVGQAFVSRDNGATWSPFQPKTKQIAYSDSPISEVGNGEFLCVPHVPAMDISKLKNMPEPVGEFQNFFKRRYYRLDQCPKVVQKYISSIVGYRWTPKTKRWRPEPIAYDLRDALIEVGEQPNGLFISRTSFEYPLLAADGNLYLADYRFRYLNRDGSVPNSSVVTCMVSRDGGRTFERGGTIAEDRSGSGQPTETSLALTSEGTLIAVGRASSEKPRPSWITFSTDEGRTWSPYQTFLEEGGKQPTLSLLENGVLVLAASSPSLWLSFSPDGKGVKWTRPSYLPRADNASGVFGTCGYTGIVNLAPNEFLLAYSDFDVPRADGQRCKGILVRRIQVNQN